MATYPGSPGEGEPRERCVLFAASDIPERKKLEDDLRLTGRLFRLQDEERGRIARELHDDTAQHLVGLCMNLAKLREHGSTWDSEQDQILADSQTLADLSIRGIRTLSYLLHPPLLDHGGLAAAVNWYAKGFIRRSGIRVELSIENIGRFGSGARDRPVSRRPGGSDQHPQTFGRRQREHSHGKKRRAGHSGNHE